MISNKYFQIICLAFVCVQINSIVLRDRVNNENLDNIFDQHGCFDNEFFKTNGLTKDRTGKPTVTITPPIKKPALAAGRRLGAGADSGLAFNQDYKTVANAISDSTARAIASAEDNSVSLAGSNANDSQTAVATGANNSASIANSLGDTNVNTAVLAAKNSKATGLSASKSTGNSLSTADNGSISIANSKTKNLSDNNTAATNDSVAAGITNIVGGTNSLAAAKDKSVARSNALDTRPFSIIRTLHEYPIFSYFVVHYAPSVFSYFVVH